MNRKKTLSIALICAILVTIPILQTRAATNTSVVGTGTIQSITFDTNTTTNVTTVVVIILDSANQAQSDRLSLESAITLGLVIPDSTMIGKNITITDPIDPTKNVTGVVKSLAFVTDPVTKITSLSVTLTNALNVDQVVSLDLEKALSLGLIAPDAAKIGTPIVIDPTLIQDSTTYSKTISALGGYFGAALGVTLDQLAAYQKAGFGYGVITQALWIATDLKGNATLLDQILNAKKTGDFSTIVLPDGKKVANWGQLRKSVLTDPHQNLGSIMSGKATPLPTLTPTPTTTPTVTTNTSQPSHGNGNGGGHGNGHGRNK